MIGVLVLYLDYKQRYHVQHATLSQLPLRLPGFRLQEIDAVIQD